MLYFVQSEKTGQIKIGYTALSIKNRLASLQSSHGALRLLVTIEGGREAEIDLHTRFAKHLRSGEWFKPHSDLLSFIGALQISKANPRGKNARKPLQVLLNKEERDELDAAADADGVSTSTWLRVLGLREARRIRSAS